MTDPQNRRGLEKLGGYIGGCYVRARGIVSPFRTCAYVRVHACHIGAEAPNHEIDIPTLATLQRRMKVNGISMNDIQFWCSKRMCKKRHIKTCKNELKKYIEK